jgi:acetaldehyde dehydrogenase (acetylating)
MKHKAIKIISMILVLSVILGALVIPVSAYEDEFEESQAQNIFEIIYSGVLIAVGVILSVVAVVELIFEYLVSSVVSLISGTA